MERKLYADKQTGKLADRQTDLMYAGGQIQQAYRQASRRRQIRI